MNTIKHYVVAALGLIVILIIAKGLLTVGKKAPVIGGAVSKVEDLTGLQG
jgi:hypothetical protein